MRLKKSDLVILPCTSGKKGRRTKWPEKRLRDLLGPHAAKILRAGRKAAFNDSRTRFFPKTTGYPKTPRRALLDMYSGYLYTLPFKRLLRRLLRHGVYVLILTGGHGLGHPQERKRKYDAHLPALSRVWKKHLPMILDDFITRTRIRRLFIACSQSYARVLSSGSDKWAAKVSVFWFTPRSRAGKGNRAADIAVQIRAAIRALAKSGKPDKRWKRGPKPDLTRSRRTRH
jgi:hypothetical protein